MIDPYTHLAMWKLETAERELRLARGLRPGFLLTGVLPLLAARWRDRGRGAAAAVRAASHPPASGAATRATVWSAHSQR